MCKFCGRQRGGVVCGYCGWTPGSVIYDLRRECVELEKLDGVFAQDLAEMAENE